MKDGLYLLNYADDEVNYSLHFDDYRTYYVYGSNQDEHTINYNMTSIMLFNLI